MSISVRCSSSAVAISYSDCCSERLCTAAKRSNSSVRATANDSAPEPIWGHAADIEPQETVAPGLTRRELIDPTQPAFDFNMSLMEFKPGVELPFVEIHDEEHGLYMTAGGGSYVLDSDEHTVMAHDFIYMAPYCPQWFRAGDEGAEYLLYKDVYRDGF
jgi:(S)-ureidoglycine aminohydrolase